MSITIFKFPVVCSKNLSENDKEHEKILVDKEVQTDEKYSKIPKLGNYNKNDFLQKKRIRKIKKKKSGRKKKNDQSIRTHSKYSNDNCIYKIKNKSFNCIFFTLNNLLKLIPSQEKFKKIKSSILKDNSKLYNEKLLQTKIKDILLLKISSKYTIPYNYNNQDIINKYSSNELIKEILNMNYEDCIQNLFMMNSNDFKEKYSFENNLLFENLIIQDEKEYSILKNLINKGIINYFKKIKPRKLRTKKVI